MVDLPKRGWFLAGTVVLVVAVVVGIAVVLTRDDRGTQPSAVAAPYPTGERTCDSLDAACTRPGTIRWSVPLADPYVESGGFLYPYGTGSARVHECSRKVGNAFYLYVRETLRAYDATSGRLRWTVDVPLIRPPGGYCRLYADARHVLVVATEVKDTPDVAAAVAAEDGRVVGTWSAPYTYTTDTAALAYAIGLVGDRAVWFRRSGEVCAVDLITGRRVWTAAVAPFVGYHVEGQQLFLDESGGDAPLTRGVERLQRIDLGTGAVSHLRLPTSPGAGGRLYTGRSDVTPYQGLPGLLLVTTNDAAVAIDTDDGSTRWRRVTGQVRRPGDRSYVQQIRHVDEVAGVVYVEAAADRQVHAVDATTGAVSESFSDNGIKGWAVVNGVGVFDAVDGVVPVLLGRDPRTGEVRWQVPAPRSFSSASHDGTIPRVVIGVGCADDGRDPSPMPMRERRCAAVTLLAVNV